MPSNSCDSLSQCHPSTKPARKNASSTYPLPKSTEPTLRKNRKNGASPQGLQDNRDNDRLHPVQNARGLRKRAVSDIDRSDNGDEKHRRQDEAAPCNQEPGPSGLPVSDMDRHLGRVWPGNQVGRTEQVEKRLAREPSATLDDFVFHHVDMRR